MLIEAVEENLRFSRFSLEPRPHPSVPAEHRVARQVARGLGDGLRTWRIGSDELVGERAIPRLHRRDVILRSSGRREALALVGIVAHQNRSVVVAPGFVELELVVRNDPSVYDRPRPALAAASGGKLVGGDLAQIRDGCGSRPLDIRLAGALRIGEAYVKEIGRGHV